MHPLQRAVALVTSVRAALERGESPSEAAIEVAGLLSDVREEDWRPLVATLAAMSATLLPEEGEDARSLLRLIGMQFAAEDS